MSELPWRLDTWVLVKIRAPFWGALNIRCRIVFGTPKGTIILTTTQVDLDLLGF